jgi:uncharacterized protein DUF4253
MDERLLTLAAVIGRHGLPTTSLSLLHDDADAEPIAGLVVEAREALTTWQRLRLLVDDTGFWPVCLNEDRFATDVLDDLAYRRNMLAAEILVASRTIDAILLLKERAADDLYRPRFDDEVPEELGYRVIRKPWPDEGGEVRPRDSQLTLYQHESEPVTLALVPTRASWEVPAFFRWGDFNRCPGPAEHVAVLKRWHDQYGAEVVCLWRDAIELHVERLPRDRKEALKLAWEHLAYCDHITDAFTVEDLAKILMVSHVWSFWWD